MAGEGQIIIQDNLRIMFMKDMDAYWLKTSFIRASLQVAYIMEQGFTLRVMKVVFIINKKYGKIIRLMFLYRICLERIQKSYLGVKKKILIFNRYILVNLLMEIKMDMAKYGNNKGIIGILVNFHMECIMEMVLYILPMGKSAKEHFQKEK